MEDAAKHQRFSDARIGHLATASASGRPHVVPCCFAVTGTRVFTAVDAKPKTTNRLQRIRNLEANPSVSLLVDHYDDDWTQLWWARVDGVARVRDEGDEYNAALDLLATKYAQYRETRPPGPVIVIDIEQWRAWP